MKKYKLKNIKCKKYPDLPYIVNIDKTKISRIVAIGDIHGDLDLAINLLKLGNIIIEIPNKEPNTIKLVYKYRFENNDMPIIKYFKWIASKTIVIQVGDQVDRCRSNNKKCHNINETYMDEASDIKILYFFYKLHKLGLKNGCAVYSLLGNHELLNVIGNLDYVSYLGLQEFNQKGKIENIFKNRNDAFNTNSKKIFHKKSNLATFLGCTRQSSIIVGDYLFVHAGIINKFIDNFKKDGINKMDTLHMINKIIQKWLLNDIKLQDNTFLQKILYDKDLSPFWPRFLGNLESGLNKDNKLCVDNINPILEYFEIKGIVIGHTPQIGQNINSTCGNSIWRVDFAGSKAFENIIDNKPETIEGRRPQILEINFHDTLPDTYKIYKLMNDGSIMII